jgi:hypothetical protein
MVIFRRIEGIWVFCVLGVGLVFEPLRIGYVGDYLPASWHYVL